MLTITYLPEAFVLFLSCSSSLWIFTHCWHMTRYRLNCLLATRVTNTHLLICLNAGTYLRINFLIPYFNLLLSLCKSFLFFFLLHTHIYIYMYAWYIYIYTHDFETEMYFMYLSNTSRHYTADECWKCKILYDVSRWRSKQSAFVWTFPSHLNTGNFYKDHCKDKPNHVDNIYNK